MDKTLSHIGTPRHSGRYPWGSGKNPQQRAKDFLGYVDNLKKKGMTDAQIAEGMGIKSTQLRIKRSLANAEKKKADIAMAVRLKEKGLSNVAIGKRMGGINESSVRSLLKASMDDKQNILETTANMIKASVDKKKYVDVGVGAENHLGISRTKLKTAIAILEEQGYKIHYTNVHQIGTGKKTSLMVLAKPGVTGTEIFANKDKIGMITDYSEDGGRTYTSIKPVRSIDSKRIQVRYHEDGGSDMDGVIQLRQGVPELSLGGKRYAQVRIAVDGSHYMKGMAMYADKMPDGVDIIYNTNKKKGTPLLGPKDNTVAKPLSKLDNGEVDHENPFGTTIRQKHYTDPKGKEQLSALNIVGSKDGAGEEGAWAKWSKTLSSQVLSKQNTSLAKKQLGLAYDAKREELDEIMSLTNPAVKKKLLEAFADNADSAAVHLKAAALPRQQSHVILPIPNMKPTEVYANNYNNGEQVVLIRYPHGGIFEIPQLTVNNNHPTAKKLLGPAEDAIGIHPSVAAKLSGADFDGDTVLVIPNPVVRGNQRLIKTADSLKELKDFDPKQAYPYYEGMQVMTTKGTGLKMGDISNLITDMTIKGATDDQLARAVKHSMVVIDAQKHRLDWKQSAIDNNIAALKKEYQGKSTAGAATLISRASSSKRVTYRTDGVIVTDPVTGKTKKQYVDPDTGEKLYTYEKQTYTNKKGKEIERTIKSTKMYETKDAFELSSGTLMEAAYATHANGLKAMANEARKAALKTPPLVYSPAAKQKYSREVDSLNAQLNLTFRNKPLERRAQLLANANVAAKKAAKPYMDPDELKKIKFQALAEARNRVGAKKEGVVISDREWEAIQAGAISNSALVKILNNTDLDRVKTLATPRTATTMTPSKIERAKALLANGNSRADVAAHLGVSVSMLARSMNE